MSAVLVLVVALSLAFGVGLGYAIIFGVLYAFDRGRHSAQPRPAQLMNSTAGSE
jgi:hypothetical protein